MNFYMHCCSKTLVWGVNKKDNISLTYTRDKETSTMRETYRYKEKTLYIVNERYKNLYLSISINFLPFKIRLILYADFQKVSSHTTLKLLTKL